MKFTVSTVKALLKAHSQSVPAIVCAIGCRKMHFGLPGKNANTLFSILHHLSPVILANAAVVAFILLRNSRFNFQCYTQREATPTHKSARKWRCDLSRLLARKIRKGIHSCKPASLNRPTDDLHWLPVSHRIEYKTANVCYNVISGFAPPYLADLQLYIPFRSLRLSADSSIFCRERF